MKRMKSIDETANIPPEDWEKVLQLMKGDVGKGRLVTFSTEKTESWIYRLWMRRKEAR